MLLEKVIDYFADALDVRVASEVPEERPERVLVVTSAGGSFDRFTESPRISLDAWAESDAAAASMLADAQSAAAEMPDHIHEVVRVGGTGQYRVGLDGRHRIRGIDITVIANRID